MKLLSKLCRSWNSANSTPKTSTPEKGFASYFINKIFFSINIFSVIFLGIIMAALIFYHFKILSWKRDAKILIETIRAIKPKMIKKIDIYGDYYGYTCLDAPNVNSGNSKRLFAEAMHDLMEYYPNHDADVQSFFIRMFTTTGEKYEFNLWLKPDITGTVFLCASYAGNTNCGSLKHSEHLGFRKSSSLYRWLEYHKLIKENNPESKPTWNKIVGR